MWIYRQIQRGRAEILLIRICETTSGVNRFRRYHVMKWYHRRPRAHGDRLTCWLHGWVTWFWTSEAKTSNVSLVCSWYSVNACDFVIFLTASRLRSTCFFKWNSPHFDRGQTRQSAKTRVVCRVASNANEWRMTSMTLKQLYILGSYRLTCRLLFLFGNK